MRFASPRRVAVAALVAGGLTVLAAPASHAVVDPMATLDCLLATPAEVTTLVDPTALAAPEVPASHCLAP